MHITKQAYSHNVIELFESQVQKNPDYIALVDKKNQYTYRELNGKINQIAASLHKIPIKQGDFVAILLDPGADFIVFILAIVKLGAIYVPLDTMAPNARLKDILNDAKPALVITNEDYQSQLTEFNTPSRLAKHLHLESISYAKENLAISIAPDAPLHMIYTSGSTGRPKGVIIPHQAVVNLAHVENYASVKKNETVAQFNNLAFDASTFEIWSALLNGGRLSVIPTEARGNYTELKKMLASCSIKHILLPTAFFHQLIKSAPDTLNPVDALIFGGEQINPILLRQFIVYRRQSNLPVTLINGYGPSEATVVACRHIIDQDRLDDDEHLSSIGNKFSNVETYVLNENMQISTEGELHISGIHLAIGYHNSYTLTQEKFIPNPFCDKAPFQRLYKTGDLVQQLPSGELLYAGRVDDQVKVGGFRIHLSEVERQLMKHEAISLAAVTVELGGGLHKMLTAYMVFSSQETVLHADDIRVFLSANLPPYMLPAKYVMVEKLPLTLIGKVDKRGLDKVPHTDLSFHTDTSSSSSIEETIKNVWKHLLNRSSIETHKNLFELGANSLLITEACTSINEALQSELQIADMLAHPTIHKLSRFIEGDIDAPVVRMKRPLSTSEVAIIGMSCRFPKANNLQEFWDNICQGKDCLTRFNEEQIKSPLFANENFVPVKGVLSDIEQFDAAFFGFSPVDANITDPQQRVFLECAWDALEHAAIAPSKLNSQVISVFAGMTDSTYLHENLLKNHRFCDEYDQFQQRIATSTSMLSTQTSYRLNLKGRSLNVNTACSTGLITVDQACQDLILGNSDIALAGASSISVPQANGYRYQQGSIVSPDGCCRPFAENANGTVFSNGVGVVVLKRLEDAIKDHDTIYAVIKASGVNNDGMDKLGFTAPSISGQRACIRDALAQANVNADEIGLLEAHGTATALGDVIEIKALTSVYREQTDKKQFCALGSVKGNIGHTDVTAGIAGIIKTALCLYHKKIPPLVQFNAPNPNLLLNESPFFVNTKLIDWEISSSKQFAGVSAFGVGGTNIHMILSGFECEKKSQDLRMPQEELIFLSAKTEKALEQRIQQLTQYLDLNPRLNEQLTNVAYTLHTGRDDFQWRRFGIGKNTTELQTNLTHKSSVFFDEDIRHSIIFMFSGQGMQYHQMAMELFEIVPSFQECIKKGVLIAKPYLNCDLLDIIRNPNNAQLTQTEYAQPALFIIEYALARLLLDCGIKPDALIGHSIGEYVAACLAGVFSFEDGIALVCERGLLMAHAPKGEMLALECTEKECIAYQNIAHVELALHNATQNYILAGTADEIATLVQHLSKTEKPFQKLNVSHAFHSRLMEALEKPFKDIFSNITLSAPSIPIVSNVTGDWLSAHDAINPDYWYRHLRYTVQLCKGINLLLQDKHPIFLEVGLGHALCGFVKEISGGKAFVTHTLPSHHRRSSDLTQFLKAMGELWGKGVTIDMEPLYNTQNRQRIPLPTYPFQKQRYWIEPDNTKKLNHGEPVMYKPVWSHQQAYIKPTSLQTAALAKHSLIIFKDKEGLGKQFISLLKKYDIQPIVVTFETTYLEKDCLDFKIDPTNKNHYIALIKSIKTNIKNPIILHLASYSNMDDDFPTSNEIDNQLSLGFYSILYLTQAYIQEVGDHVPLHVGIITTGTQQILGTEVINPINAALIGSCRVIMQEHSEIKFRIVDLNPAEQPQENENLLNNIIDSCLNDPWNESSFIVPYRNGYQWSLMYGVIKPVQKKMDRLKDKGVYVLTGGLGGIALSCCEAINETVSSSTFILLFRSQFPLETEWETILQNSKHKYHAKINQIRTLQALGATFVFYQVDISQFDLLDNIIGQCIARFGKINGLIHTAGVSSAELVQYKLRMMAQDVFSPKIYGTYNLIRALKDLSLDFVILKSSLASLLGGFRQVDYCAANACLDAFSNSNYFSFSSFLASINWNTWRDVGIAAEAALKGEPTFLGMGNDISPQQGKKIFLDVLQGNESQVAISNVDINFDAITMHEQNTANSTLLDVKISRQHLNVITTYLEPCNEIESKLVQIWQDMLGIEGIGINDDFFALGGHSLKALNLIEQVNKTFDCSLSPTQIYRNSTIKQLCSTILMGSTNKKPTILVPLKLIGEKPPYLFVCHPISGLINCFSFLTSQSELPVSIYGLQDPSIEANKMLYGSLLDMAKDYLAAIKKIQPIGPYFLMGYSFGGNVLYEVANLIQQEGQKISLLAMIDSWAINPEIQRREGYFKNQFKSLHKSLSKPLVDLAWERENLLLNHSLSNMNQEITLFKASQLFDDYKSIDHPTNGWSNYNKGTIISHEIDGNHDTIINSDNSKNIMLLIKDKLLKNGSDYNETIKE